MMGQLGAKLGLLLVLSLFAACSKKKDVTISAPPTLSQPHKNENQERWASYYDNKLQPEAFFSFDTIVFDLDRHPNLRPLSDREKLVLASISLGRYGNSRKYFADLKEQGLLLQKNPNETVSLIDIRDKRWTRHLIEKIVPSALQQGFGGVLFDDLESALNSEKKEPTRYAGMADAIIKNIKTVRLHFPSIKIMISCGYGILEKLAPYIDMTLSDGLLTTSNLVITQGKSPYELKKDNAYSLQIAELNKAQHINTQLKRYALDYWDNQDIKTIKMLYKKQQSLGFVPYVATPGWLLLSKEPGL